MHTVNKDENSNQYMLPVYKYLTYPIRHFITFHQASILKFSVNIMNECWSQSHDNLKYQTITQL